MSASEKAGLRILSLEDSELDAELILRELKLGGIEFVSCRVQTRDDFEREIVAFQPDLILSDYRLPGFDGGQALAIAMERCPSVPFIIISGAVGEETAVELLKNGATDFVLKDRLARLVPVVHRALREVAERNARIQAETNLRALNEELEERVAVRTRELWEKNAVMEEDLTMARELQMALLPSGFPTLPRGVAQAARETAKRPTSRWRMRPHSGARAAGPVGERRQSAPSPACTIKTSTLGAASMPEACIARMSSTVRFGFGTALSKIGMVKVLLLSPN